MAGIWNKRKQTNTPLKNKVLVGMSGGVDSSVSAVLLLEQGYEVIGAFMKNWTGTNRTDGGFVECAWKQERRDAARVAAKLGIPFLTLDFEESYRRDVVDQMFAEVKAGRTPNPDVLCNKHIKFDLFVKAADELDCAFVATGHYAQIKNGQLVKAVDQNKDQTYFLWAINPSILSRVLFPIGHLTKPEVRQKAREQALDVAEKKDSTGICFVGEVEMREFLRERIPDDPGVVITTDGVRVGQHSGVNFYTIGQRRGLHIGGGMPYYVVEKRTKTKELVVSSNFHPRLFSKELFAHHLNLFAPPTSEMGRYDTRIRHRQPLQSCHAEFLNGNRVRVIFDDPQRAVTPGQSIVFYQKEVVIGGGVIEDFLTSSIQA